VGRVIEILVLQAKALQAQGKIDQALTALERALFLAEPEGYVRTFVNEGVESTLGKTSKSKSKVPRYPSGGLCVLPTQSPT